MADRIRLDPDVLGDLAADCSQLARDLRDVGCRTHSFEDAPPVEDAYHDFERRWDQRRGEVVEHVDVVVKAMRSILLEFQWADLELERSLDGEAG